MPLLGLNFLLGGVNVNGVAISVFFQGRDQLVDRDWPVAKQSTAFFEGTWRGIQAKLRQSADEQAGVTALPSVAPAPSQELKLGFKSDVAHYSATLAPLRKRSVVID